MCRTLGRTKNNEDSLLLLQALPTPRVPPYPSYLPRVFPRGSVLSPFSPLVPLLSTVLLTPPVPRPCRRPAGPSALWTSFALLTLRPETRNVRYVARLVHPGPHRCSCPPVRPLQIPGGAPGTPPSPIVLALPRLVAAPEEFGWRPTRSAIRAIRVKGAARR